MGSSSASSIDVQVEGFYIPGIYGSLKHALQFPIYGVSPAEDLSQCKEELLQYYANLHLVNLALSAVKGKDAWTDYHDDREFMLAVSGDLRQHFVSRLFDALY